MIDTKALAVKGAGDLIDFSPEVIDVIRASKCPKLTDSEFMAFIMVAKRRGLDPILNQIHAVPRPCKTVDPKTKRETWNQVVTFQTGIDGYRLIGARTKELAGCDEPEFGEFTGKKPEWARVTVYRMIEGQRCPFTATAYWDEYYPGDGPHSFMWRKMPKGQLAKCAETLALRKAFPGDFSGLYTDDEMHQVVNENSLITTNAQAVEEQLNTAPTEDDITDIDSTPVKECPECSTPMLISKYEHKEWGHKPWYCPSCRLQVPIEDAK